MYVCLGKPDVTPSVTHTLSDVTVAGIFSTVEHVSELGIVFQHQRGNTESI